MATNMNKKGLSVGDEVKVNDNSWSMRLEPVDSIIQSWITNPNGLLWNFSNLKVIELDLKVPAMEDGKQETCGGEKVFLDIMLQDPDGNFWLSLSRYCKKMEKKLSQYARFFDGLSSQWANNMKQNLFFLQAQENYANDLLKSRGHLFLNEVYDMLGLSRTREGQIVGWVRDGNGDNYIDFSITTQENSSRISVDFNVDGVILDLVMEDEKQVQPNPEILAEIGKEGDLHVWCDKKYDERIRAMPGIYLVSGTMRLVGYISVHVDHRYDKVLIAKQIEALK